MFASLLVPPPGLPQHACPDRPPLGWSDVSILELSCLLGRFWQGKLVRGLQQPLSGALFWPWLASVALGRAAGQAAAGQLQACQVLWTSSYPLCITLKPHMLAPCQRELFLALLGPGQLAGQAEEPAAVL